MKVGLLSDTHNHLRESRRAIELLLARGAGHLVHCGDAGEDVVELVSAVCREHGIRAHVAIGNCDRAQGEDQPFQTAPAGVERAESPEFVLAGKRCVALHGDRSVRLEQAMDSGRFDYVFTGHTHCPADRKQGPTRLLNPGSPVRPRQGPPTVALLDLATDLAEWLPVQP
ncbi:MAG: metallophosphoesterase [Kiritimatiellia bacterium]